MLHRIRILLLALALPCACALAQVAQDDREIPEEARKQYAAALKEASTLLGDHKYALAEEKLDALLASRPREPRARFLKAVAETEQGRGDAAMTLFRALIDDYPELPEPYNNLAVILAQRGQYESARVALETAIKTAPDWSVPHENLGDIYARLAADEYGKAAKLDKTNKSAPAKLVLVRDLLATASQPKPKS